MAAQLVRGPGAPTFYFYPPLAHWLAGLFATATDPRTAVSLAGLVFLFASGVAMYAWLSPRTPYALVGAALYMLAPYHVGDFYERAALAEFSAMAWLPLIALGIERQPGRGAGVLLALSFAGLVCTHLPLALLTSAILIPPLVLWRAQAEPMIAVRCAAAGLVGLLLASFYLAPALGLQQFTLMDQLMWGADFDPARKSILAFFGGHPTPGLYLMTAIAVEWTVIVALVMRRGEHRFWGWMALWALACGVGLIPLLSLPVLEKVQFPWRAMAIVEFAGVTAVVAAMPRLPAIAAAALLALHGLTLAVHAFVDLKTSIDPEYVRRQVDALEYLPARLRPVPTQRARPELDALAGPLASGPVQIAAQERGGALELHATGDGKAVIRRAQFPRWRVTGPDGATPTGPGPLIEFEVRKGGVYRLAPVLTSDERIGWELFAAGLAGLLALALLRRRTA